jgi:hypothetical protein
MGARELWAAGAIYEHGLAYQRRVRPSVGVPIWFSYNFGICAGEPTCEKGGHIGLLPGQKLGKEDNRGLRFIDHPPYFRALGSRVLNVCA